MSKEKSIKLSEKHGVNPSMLCCPVCGKEYGIALLGKLKGDVEAPMRIIGNELCDDCKMKAGQDKVYLLAVDERNIPTKSVLINRTALKLEIKGYMAAIPESDFDKLFNFYAK